MRKTVKIVIDTAELDESRIEAFNQYLYKVMTKIRQASLFNPKQIKAKRLLDSMPEEERKAVFDYYYE
jgi:hypothetical protein